MKQAIILHNPVSDTSKEDELDVLNQADFIETALEKLGYRFQRMAFDLNSNDLIDAIKKNNVSVVFNLVETINDSGRLSFFTPALLELIKVPFTGAGAEAIFMTTEKIVCKTILSVNKISTPSWAKYISEVEPENSTSLNQFPKMDL
jgi:D-alanine-D-alanine ligase